MNKRYLLIILASLPFISAAQRKEKEKVLSIECCMAPTPFLTQSDFQKCLQKDEVVGTIIKHLNVELNLDGYYNTKFYPTLDKIEEGSQRQYKNVFYYDQSDVQLKLRKDSQEDEDNKISLACLSPRLNIPFSLIPENIQNNITNFTFTMKDLTDLIKEIKQKIDRGTHQVICIDKQISKNLVLDFNRTKTKQIPAGKNFENFKNLKWNELDKEKRIALVYKSPRFQITKTPATVATQDSKNSKWFSPTIAWLSWKSLAALIVGGYFLYYGWQYYHSPKSARKTKKASL